MSSAGQPEDLVGFVHLDGPAPLSHHHEIRPRPVDATALWHSSASPTDLMVIEK
ncbi:uncharacterized protein FOMMEDRAFT_162043 [Fomitiporia mediterranea MF3/22]|uniref:uncharacterized protein n=1 Tax=Fomitiporia mediterranea (strain MF3/22) TaxID=694068 RepID=UPI0004408F86|nr:uncharacterized protein FOMMEDRAFT_162043 [Fomitiporia mediterranea MF3/22]EJC98277.1 hypothetical protein FOMMEDRAFT_162043 [Fomitiporia mediterranea MF3/22]